MPETDPMLGSADEQDAYRAMIADKMRESIEELRAERREPPKESDPVMLGNQGFTGGISSA